MKRVLVLFFQNSPNRFAGNSRQQEENQMKAVTRLCLCGMLMFSFMAITGCSETKKDGKTDTKPAVTSGTDAAGAADKKDDGAESK